jgi:hypothetical protein
MTFFCRARLTGLALLTCGVLLLASCEDPSGVGLTVTDFGETDPHAQVVPAETSLDSLVDVTGFTRPLTEEFNGQFFAGRLDDPYFGRLDVHGHIDFFRPVGIDLGFTTAPLDVINLRLVPFSAAGDTSAPAMFEVYEITEAWRGFDIVSDSVLATDDRLLATFSIAPSDTLVRVALDEQWIADRDTIFRGDDLEANFHGLQIRPHPSNRMAIGFTDDSSLELIGNWNDGTDADTVYFVSGEIATTTSLDPTTGMPPQDLIPLQDGTGIGLYVDLRLDTLSNRALSAGFIRIEADTLLLREGVPSTYHRPLARTLSLYGTGSGPPTRVADAVFDPQKQAYIFQSAQLTFLMQEMALGRSPFERLAVGFPRVPSTLGYAPLVDRPEAPPRAVLLVVPSDN